MLISPHTPSATRRLASPLAKASQDMPHCAAFLAQRFAMVGFRRSQGVRIDK